MDEKFWQIISSIKQVAKEDEVAEQEGDFQEKLEVSAITSEVTESVIEQGEECLKKEPKNRTLKKIKRRLEQDILPRKKKMKNSKTC